MTVYLSRSHALPAILAAIAMVMTVTPAHAVNLFTNSSFEIGPGGTGILPTDWDIRSASPDTYIPGGGPLGRDPATIYGAASTAEDGVRWVGGYAGGGQGAFESFGQTLGSTLVPGQTYDLSGYLLENDAVFTVGNGGYEVWLGTATTDNVLLGVLAPTTGPGVWHFRSFTFVAPPTAASLPVVAFRPYAAPGYIDAWPGLDSVRLELVPEPTSAAIIALGSLVFLRRRTPGRGKSKGTGI
jgi:hypothetical protein